MTGMSLLPDRHFVLRVMDDEVVERELDLDEHQVTLYPDEQRVVIGLSGAQVAEIRGAPELTDRVVTGADRHAERKVAEAVAAERERYGQLQNEIHSLCPDARGADAMCRGGMLYGPDGKTMGSCEWRGHAVGGHT